MGVLNCDRLGCDNIMCDHLSYTYGYLCRECLEELKDSPLADICSFMESPKCKQYQSEALRRAWEAVVEEEFEEK